MQGQSCCVSGAAEKQKKQPNQLHFSLYRSLGLPSNSGVD